MILSLLCSIAQYFICFTCASDIHHTLIIADGEKLKSMSKLNGNCYECCKSFDELLKNDSKQEGFFHCSCEDVFIHINCVLITLKEKSIGYFTKYHLQLNFAEEEEAFVWNYEPGLKNDLVYTCPKCGLSVDVDYFQRKFVEFLIEKPSGKMLKLVNEFYKLFPKKISDLLSDICEKLSDSDLDRFIYNVVFSYFYDNDFALEAMAYLWKVRSMRSLSQLTSYCNIFSLIINELSKEPYDPKNVAKLVKDLPKILLTPLMLKVESAFIIENFNPKNDSKSIQKFISFCKSDIKNCLLPAQLFMLTKIHLEMANIADFTDLKELYMDSERLNISYQHFICKRFFDCIDFISVDNCPCTLEEFMKTFFSIYNGQSLFRYFIRGLGTKIDFHNKNIRNFVKTFPIHSFTNIIEDILEAFISDPEMLKGYMIFLNSHNLVKNTSYTIYVARKLSRKKDTDILNEFLKKLEFDFFDEFDLMELREIIEICDINELFEFSSILNQFYLDKSY